MFFQGWAGLGRTIVVGVLAYTALVICLRISGKRTLSKMNAFDLIVTVALGSTLATILLNKNVALAEGVLAFVVLIGLQYIVAWLSVRSAWVRSLVKSEPQMVLYEGELLDVALRKERLTREEVRTAVRESGHANLESIRAVILETDGTLTVVPRHEGEATALDAQASSLQGVRR